MNTSWLVALDKASSDWTQVWECKLRFRCISRDKKLKQRRELRIRKDDE